MRRRRALLVLLGGVLGVLLAGLLGGCGSGTATGTAAEVGTQAAPDSATDPVSGLPWVLEGELPPSAQQTLLLVDAGGPFPYDKDGSTFQNREGLLPDEPRGYYAEYTVPKPDEDDRGPWRLVTGAESEVYWTEDHYASFSRVWR
jgi:ribonuclease T1